MIGLRPATNRRATALLTLAVLGAAGLVGLSRQPREPEYDGKPLSYYLSNQTYGDLRREREAREPGRLRRRSPRQR